MNQDRTIADRLQLEIRLAVAQDAFTARRAKEEKLWCEHNGLMAPLSASRYRAMNRVVDFAMIRTNEAQELAAATLALKEHKWMVIRMKAGYSA